MFSATLALEGAEGGVVGLCRITHFLRTRSGCSVLARTCPSNSALNDKFTLYLTLHRVNGGTEIVAANIPSGFACLRGGVRRRSFAARAIIDISITTSDLLNSGVNGCVNGISLYVSRRNSGAFATGRGFISGCTTTGYRVLCGLFLEVRVGFAGSVTSYLCANVSASANYFECAGAATRAVHITTDLVSFNYGATCVGGTVFRAGSGGGVRLRETICRSVACYTSNEYTVVCAALSVLGGLGANSSRVRKLTSVPHRVRNILVKVAVHRGRNKFFGVSIHAGGGVGTSSFYSRFKNNNRPTTTNYSVRNSLRAMGAALRGTTRGFLS